MTEQEMRAEFFKRTGRVATSANVEYFAFCEGAKMEREACAAECERMMMCPGGRQESAAHHDVWAAAKAIRLRSRE